MKARINRTLADLPRTHRDAVEMALYDGMSHSEIAERLDQPIGTVKSRIRSAMTRIRDDAYGSLDYVSCAPSCCNRTVVHVVGRLGVGG